MYEPEWIQKATKYIPSKHASKIEGAWIQLKVDGQAIQAVFNDGVGPKIYSNTVPAKSDYFTDYTGCVPHIVEELASLGFEGILQGEIYADHLESDELNFKYVSVLRAKNSYERQCKEGLTKYIIYDMPSHPGTYKERYVALQKLFADTNFKYISLIPILGVNNEGSWLKVFEKLVSEGREGVVLYDPNNMYKHMTNTTGRNPGIWKIKASESKEVCAVQKLEGEWTDRGGKYVGSLGALICVDGSGKQFKVGSFKLTDEERKDIWDNVDVPFILEMRTASETIDSYRHPVMTRLRLDKDVESWNVCDI